MGKLARLAYRYLILVRINKQYASDFTPTGDRASDPSYPDELYFDQIGQILFKIKIDSDAAKICFVRPNARV